jgi:hypothetical protein
MHRSVCPLCRGRVHLPINETFVIHVQGDVIWFQAPCIFTDCNGVITRPLNRVAAGQKLTKGAALEIHDDIDNTANRLLYHVA